MKLRVLSTVLSVLLVASLAWNYCQMSMIDLYDRIDPVLMNKARTLEAENLRLKLELKKHAPPDLTSRDVVQAEIGKIASVIEKSDQPDLMYTGKLLFGVRGSLLSGGDTPRQMHKAILPFMLQQLEELEGLQKLDQKIQGSTGRT